eukprot:scaffold1014_cov260-Pinguiococcus_pyrenoidosus.AAC.20
MAWSVEKTDEMLSARGISSCTPPPIKLPMTLSPGDGPFTESPALGAAAVESSVVRLVDSSCRCKAVDASSTPSVEEPVRGNRRPDASPP